MTSIDGVISTKGGIGKTSVCANLGAILSDLNRKTVLIDLDPQGSLSGYFAISEKAEHGVTKFLTSADPTGTISKTEIDNLYVIQNDDPGNELTNWIKTNSSHFEYLKYALSRLVSDYDFDHILIDTQGSINPLQECVIRNCKRLLSPITPEFLSAQEFSRGTLLALSRMQPPSHALIPAQQLPPLHIIFSETDRTVANREIIRTFNKISFEQVRSDVFICDTQIPQKKSVYNKSVINKKPVHRIDVKRDRAKAGKGYFGTPCALETQLNLAYELFPHLEGLLPSWDGSEHPRPEYLSSMESPATPNLLIV